MKHQRNGPFRRFVGAAALAAAGTVLTAPIASAAVSEDTRRFDLSNAPVPAGMCEHPAGRLTDGSRHFPPADDDHLSGPHGDESLTMTAFGRIRGGATALGVIDCNAGGVGWPQTVVFYRKGADGKPRMLASYDLGKIRNSEHVQVRKLEISGGEVLVELDTYEGAGFEVQRINARLHVQGRKPVVTVTNRGPITNPY